MGGVRQGPKGSIDVAIIGAGQAGLATSYYLTQAGREHLVLEASDRVAESWRKRWDSFCLVSANWASSLPGLPYDGPDPDGFMLREEVVRYLERYARSIEAPIRYASKVNALRRREGEGFRLETADGPIDARTVVVATGAFQRARIPPVSRDVSKRVLQIHTDDYRNERALPAGAVMVVGSGQAGAQIVEELHEAGRSVFLCVSRCGRQRRRYRGKDIAYWAYQILHRGTEVGVPPRTVEQLPSPAAKFACNPHLSGHGGGHDINLRQLGADGVVLLGHLDAAEGDRVRFANDLEANLRFADEFFAKMVQPDFDRFIELAGIDAPVDPQAQFAYEPPTVPELDLIKAGIGSVIWTTGYRPAFSWIDMPIFEPDGYPRHQRGVTEIPGLFFIGLHWLHTFTSGLIGGVGTDAKYLVEQI
jgi:putative flavoprotein involved in K+ transport